MEFDLLSIITTIFGVAMSFAYFPQFIKILKRKSVKDISLLPYLIFFPGLVVWLIYGINKNDFPIIISNIFGLVGCALVLIAYFIYKE